MTETEIPTGIEKRKRLVNRVRRKGEYADPELSIRMMCNECEKEDWCARSDDGEHSWVEKEDDEFPKCEHCGLVKSEEIEKSLDHPESCPESAGCWLWPWRLGSLFGPVTQYSRVTTLERRSRGEDEFASRTHSIKLYCLECSGYNRAEINRCPSWYCWFYPWKTGKLDIELLEKEVKEDD